MVDSGIKKSIVNYKDLPPVNATVGGYEVRYRIISEDKNRTSHWSPVYTVENSPVTLVDGDLNITNTIIQAVWGDENSRPKYDVFVSFDEETLIYHGTTAVHTYSLLNTGISTVRVVIQIESLEKQYAPTLVIYDSEDQPLGLIS